MKTDEIATPREEVISRSGKIHSKTHSKAEDDKTQRENAASKLTMKYTKSPIKTDIYSLEKIKLTLDDLLVEYSKERGFREKYELVDISNAIGIVSIVLALAVFFLGMAYRFDEVKWIIAILVYSYFVINGIGMAISYFLGGRISFDKFEMRTRIDKTPVYVVLLYWRGRITPIKYNKDIFELFNEKGELDHSTFLKDLEYLFNE